MTRKPYRLAATALAVLIAAPLFTACKNADQALDCGKKAISLTGDVQDLADSAVNVGQITDKERRKHTVDALKKIVEDAKKIRQEGGSKLDPAADKLAKAVNDAIDKVSNGKQPDIGAITSAAGGLTAACADS
ncbi:hypothetical protein BX285_7094 [Streptomyces sp. 1114.5]|uniref:hypothetical protein n=1 Tax=unclassified Streptomyces TaxID=2593676 RepID=UPI000BCDACA7|nr:MULTISPECIES: hypothetical protein [unclassified Streptomyces]RKT08729.1 hypothetical protein BX285_7094 [Streptomyces sp. 1114.5]SOB78933.1 hypothetical protein SAMN06272789_0171 [Streptomyces sp. 1331.2]